MQTRRLNEQVRRNRDRFPQDFIFELTREEPEHLKSQFAASSRGGRRKLPFAFTEHGAIMAATVLSSPRAVEVRCTGSAPSCSSEHWPPRTRTRPKRRDALEARLEEKTELLRMQHDTFSRNARNQQRQLFEALREPTTPPDPPKRPIGFIAPEEKKSKAAGKAASKTDARRKA